MKILVVYAASRLIIPIDASNKTVFCMPANTVYGGTFFS